RRTHARPDHCRHLDTRLPAGTRRHRRRRHRRHATGRRTRLHRRHGARRPHLRRAAEPLHAEQPGLLGPGGHARRHHRARCDPAAPVLQRPPDLARPACATAVQSRTTHPSRTVPPVQGGTMSRIPRRWLSVTALTSAALLVAGCTSNEPQTEDDGGDDAAQAAPAGANDEPGETVTIGFSAPAADHGWMGAITTAAQEEADRFEDIDLQVAEGTNDVNVQISQVEQFINDGVDAIVVLPFDGAALTEVATQAMQEGIPVVNVDREFSTPEAARVTVLGDNYGMGRSAGEYICERLGDQGDAVIAEIAGIDSLPLTQDRSQG